MGGEGGVYDILVRNKSINLKNLTLRPRNTKKSGHNSDLAMGKGPYMKQENNKPEITTV